MISIEELKTRLLAFVFACTLAYTGQAQTATVNWDANDGVITKDHWGVNDYQVKDISNSADTGYNGFLKRLNPSIIRIHNAGLIDSWTTAPAGSNPGKWNVSKIKACFNNLKPGYGTSKIMLNLNWWPSWIAPSDTQLSAAKQAVWLKLVAQLPRIMKDSVKRDIDMWEVLNEREDSYASNLPGLYSLAGKMIDSIRKTYPTAVCGGTAFTYGNPAWRDAMLNAIGSKLNFLSYHSYSTCSTNSDSTLMRDNGNYTATEMIKVRNTYPNMKVYLDELNVNCDWQNYDARMSNTTGTIYLAQYIRNTARVGVDGVMVWNSKDNIYGILKSSPNNELKPQAVLYNWAQKFLVGTLKQSTSSDLGYLEVIPVVCADGTKSLLILNKKTTNLTLTSGQSMIPAGNVISRVEQLTGTNGTATVLSTTNLNGIVLPGRSLTLVRISQTRAIEITSAPNTVSTKGNTNFKVTTFYKSSGGMQVYLSLYNPNDSALNTQYVWVSGTGSNTFTFKVPVTTVAGNGKLIATYFGTGYSTLGKDTMTVAFVKPPCWIESSTASIPAAGGTVNATVSFAAPSGTGMVLYLDVLSTTNAVLVSGSQWVSGTGSRTFTLTVPATSSGTGTLKATYFGSGYSLLGQHTKPISFTSAMIRGGNNGEVSPRQPVVAFPNPAKRFVRLYSADDFINDPQSELGLINSQGQRVLHGSANLLLDGNQSLSLEKLPMGIYYLQLTNPTLDPVSIRVAVQ